MKAESEQSEQSELVRLYHSNSIDDTSPLFRKVDTDLWGQLQGSDSLCFKLWLQKDLLQYYLHAAESSQQVASLSAEMKWFGDHGGTCAVDAVLTAMSGVSWDLIAKQTCLNLAGNSILMAETIITCPRLLSQRILSRVASARFKEARHDLCVLLQEFWNDDTQVADPLDKRLFCQRDAGWSIQCLLKEFAGLEPRGVNDEKSGLQLARKGILNQFDVWLMVFAIALSKVSPMEPYEDLTVLKQEQRRQQGEFVTAVSQIVKGGLQEEDIDIFFKDIFAQKPSCDFLRAPGVRHTGFLVIMIAKLAKDSCRTSDDAAWLFRQINVLIDNMKDRFKYLGQEMKVQPPSTPSTSLSSKRSLNETEGEPSTGGTGPRCSSG